jgi:hypothetical protein
MCSDYSSPDRPRGSRIFDRLVALLDYASRVPRPTARLRRPAPSTFRLTTRRSTWSCPVSRSITFRSAAGPTPCARCSACLRPGGRVFIADLRPPTGPVLSRIGAAFTAHAMAHDNRRRDRRARLRQRVHYHRHRQHETGALREGAAAAGVTDSGPSNTRRHLRHANSCKTRGKYVIEINNGLINNVCTVNGQAGGSCDEDVRG